MIGYYVHHHGSGHRARYDSVAPLLGDVAAISEVDIAGGLRLPTDVPVGTPVDPDAGGALHWAPLYQGAAPRLKIFAEWLASNGPCGVVADVSVEAAVVCRLAGVPTVVVRQLGHRDDRAHDLGYRVASRLVAPWPRELDDDVADWIRDKTDYVGYVRQECANPRGRVAGGPGAVRIRPEDIVVLWGAGGGRLSGHAIDAIASNCAGTVWCVGADVVDNATEGGVASNVAVLGWRSDLDSILSSSPVVVSSAGNNIIAAAARWSCPLVLLPQRRPFGEQHLHARRLAALGAAVVVVDADAEKAWSSRFREARSCRARLGALYRVGGAQRFADAARSAFGCR